MANETERAIGIVNYVLSHYPTDIFPADSSTPDALAAKGARVACNTILHYLRQEPCDD